MAESTDETPKPAAQVEFLDVPHDISKKVMGGGPISSAMIDRVESIIENHGVNFRLQAEMQIEDLMKTVREAKAAATLPEDFYEDVFRKSHDIRGRAATFGYGLVTEIGNSLCNFAEAVTDHDDQAMEVITAHVDAMRAVLANDIKGDGDATGREIVESLSIAVTKALPEAEPDTE